MRKRGTDLGEVTIDIFTCNFASVRNVINNLRFPGQYYDAETGLHQNGFRSYLPPDGRYLEADSIGIQHGKNHLYAYANNDPVNNSDPSGLELISAKEGEKIITAGEKYIGTPYSKMDCSHFVNTAYTDAGFPYKYATTGQLDKSPSFKKVSLCQVGDVALFPGHMGLYNPNSPQAGYNILSATTSKGVIYGKASWFGSYSCYRYDKCSNK